MHNGHVVCVCCRRWVTYKVVSKQALIPDADLPLLVYSLHEWLSGLLDRAFSCQSVAVLCVAAFIYENEGPQSYFRSSFLSSDVSQVLGGAKSSQYELSLRY
jgi:hypothetical protein